MGGIGKVAEQPQQLGAAPEQLNPSSVPPDRATEARETKILGADR